MFSFAFEPPRRTKKFVRRSWTVSTTDGEADSALARVERIFGSFKLAPFGLRYSVAIPPRPDIELETYKLEVVFQHIDARGANSYASVIAERIYADPPLDVDVGLPEPVNLGNAPQPQLTADEAREILEWLPEDSIPETVVEKLEALAKTRDARG